MINLKNLGFFKKADKYLEEKCKFYFLIKKINVYEKKMSNRSGFSFRKIFSYEKRWKSIIQKNKEINLYGIEFVSIGETISRLFMFQKDQGKNKGSELNVVLPVFFTKYYTGGIVNKAIFVIFENYIQFIKEENISFWKYAIIMHHNKINIQYFNAYKQRDNSIQFNIELGIPLIPLNRKIEIYALEKKQNMGLTGKFICIHAREVATKKNNFISSYDDTSIIDSDINSYNQACAYMYKLGYQIVRLGKDESKQCLISDVIDYANSYYDELMDFYLVANCKFLLGCSSGITSIAAFWGRPILQTNAMSFCYGQESLPRTKYDLYIPKKFYSNAKGRFLNLYEMWDVSFKCDRYTERFHAEGIKVFDNTEEEILNATIEMNERIDHTWICTEDEIKCMEKYWQIINLWKEKHEISYISKNDGGLGRDMFSRPICYSYLKENMYLLEGVCISR